MAYKYCKRLFDISVSILSLIFLSPLLAISAILIKVDSEGPIFFIQDRVGKDGKVFSLLKFRTMKKSSKDTSRNITSQDDPRKTQVGNLLRKIKLDEMPQLINVLKGEMSLVGPRPEVPEYVEMFKEDYQDILTVKPGMTDPGTVYFRNEESLLEKAGDSEEFYINSIIPKKLEFYRMYLEKRSFFYDLKLIFLEFFAIILPTSIFHNIFLRNFEKDLSNFDENKLI